MHLLQLPVLEPVGLQIRKTPIGIAKTGARRGRGAIRGDGLLATPERLERVSDRQVQISRLRGTDQELAVNFDGTFVCAKTYVGQRTERAVVTIGGINGEQLVGLLLRLRVHYAL